MNGFCLIPKETYARGIYKMSEDLLSLLKEELKTIARYKFTNHLGMRISRKGDIDFYQDIGFKEQGSIPTRPRYDGSYAEIAEISQCEFGVTRGDDVKPVLATYGLGSCVSLSGWSPKHKLGFLTHYDGMTELPHSFDHLLGIVSEQLKGEASEFDVRIVGGWRHQSENLIDAIKMRLNIREDISMKLIEEDTCGNIESRNIALDTRSGKVFSYDPLLNPGRRDITEFDILRITAGIKTTALLAYCPE